MKNLEAQARRAQLEQAVAIINKYLPSFVRINADWKLTTATPVENLQQVLDEAMQKATPELEALGIHVDWRSRHG